MKGEIELKIKILGDGSFNEIAKRSIKNFQSNEPNLLLTVQEFNEKRLDILPDIESEGTNIVITGRFTQPIIQKYVNIPVINLKLTPTDLFIALQNSKPLPQNIAIALSNIEDLEYDYSVLENLLGITFTYINYQTYAELQSKVQSFSHTKGIIIGTGYAMQVANEHSLYGALIYSESSITESIERAIEIMRFKQSEEHQNNKLKTIINSVTEGIIATDNKHHITIMNNSAKTLLNENKDHMTKEKLFDFFPKEAIDSPPFYNKIIDLGNIKINTNMIPIQNGKERAGDVISFQNITSIQEAEQKYRKEIESKGLTAQFSFSDLIYTSSSMQKAVNRAKKFSQTDSTILISGETGTGKELIAHSIHNFSHRRTYPFVAINCAALPEALLESELFGYEDGAFTGAAKKGKKGLFELAHKGTIFLDEINSISLHFQTKLLRVLQEKEVIRVGGNEVRSVNIRVLVASNEDLIQLVKEKKFRADLYYRINILNVTLPPLCHRKKDIPVLSYDFIYSFNNQFYQQVTSFLPELTAELSKYDFPGNIRELFNILERFVILAKTEDEYTLKNLIQLLRECINEQYPADIQYRVSNQAVTFELQDNYKESIMAAEKEILKAFIRIWGYDKTSLSKKLELGRTTLYRKIKELDI